MSGSYQETTEAERRFWTWVFWVSLVLLPVMPWTLAFTGAVVGPYFAGAFWAGIHGWKLMLPYMGILTPLLVVSFVGSAVSALVGLLYLAFSGGGTAQGYLAGFGLLVRISYWFVSVMFLGFILTVVGFRILYRDPIPDGVVWMPLAICFWGLFVCFALGYSDRFLKRLPKDPLRDPF